jgi:hypothetical protein
MQGHPPSAGSRHHCFSAWRLTEVSIAMGVGFVYTVRIEDAPPGRSAVPFLLLLLSRIYGQALAMATVGKLAGYGWHQHSA